MAGSKAFTPAGLPGRCGGGEAVFDGGAHLGVFLLAQQPHGGGEVGGPDEDGVHAVDRQDVLHGVHRGRRIRSGR